MEDTPISESKYRSAGKTYPACYRTRMFVTVFTQPHQWTHLREINPTFTSQPNSVRQILIVQQAITNLISNYATTLCSINAELGCA
jgi:hypothetical protein